MTYCTASVVAEELYRGTEFDLTVEILDKDGGVYPLTNEETRLYLAHSWTIGEPVLELEGIIINGNAGLVNFNFSPEDTEDLPARAYDMTITVEGNVAFQGKLGILGRIEAGENSE